MKTKIKNYIKLVVVRRKNKNISLASSANVNINAVFEGNNKIGPHTTFSGRIGYGSYIGENSNVSAGIGRYCSIGSNFNVLSGTHPTSGFVSTSPLFYSTDKQSNSTFATEQVFNEHLFADEKNQLGVLIGNDVWVGFGVTMMGGITIGDGAIIAANAYVNKDVAPYSIVAGLPAKEIGKRFDDETVDLLNSSKWWDKPEDWIAKNWRNFSDVDAFKELMKK